MPLFLFLFHTQFILSVIQLHYHVFCKQTYNLAGFKLGPSVPEAVAMPTLPRRQGMTIFQLFFQCFGADTYISLVHKQFIFNLLYTKSLLRFPKILLPCQDSNPGLLFQFQRPILNFTPRGKL
jgi:hypothetical protein